MTIPELNSTIDSLEAGTRLTAYEKELLHLARHMQAISMYYLQSNFRQSGGDHELAAALEISMEPFYKERTER